MSSPFDISRFPDLPPEVLKAFEAPQAALEASRMEAILAGFEGTIQVNAFGAYTHLSKPSRPSPNPPARAAAR